MFVKIICYWKSVRLYTTNFFVSRLGAHRKEVKEDATQEFEVIKIVRHPDYNAKGNTENDMALIKLNREAVLGPGVGLVCLGDNSNHLPLDDLNNQCLISGWGTLESGGNQPDVLHEVMVPLVSKSVCQGAYGNLHDSMLCAGFKQGGKDSCQGDSGGPLVCQFWSLWADCVSQMGSPSGEFDCRKMLESRSRWLVVGIFVIFFLLYPLAI